jgi:uncharacterized protein (TIGR02996 family)
MSVETAMLKSIEANLADPMPLLVFADWLEEQGADELAHAWRWMARRGYRPAKRQRRLARIPWAWWNVSSHEMESHPEDLSELRSHPEARLPMLLFRAMGPRGSAGPHIYCRSLIDAVGRLSKGLQVLLELAGLERQPGDP